MGQERLQAPTLESMLLRMEEIQVRGTHQWKVTMELERSLVTGLVFIMSCYDSCGLRLHTDAFSRLDYTVQFVWQGSLSVGCCVYRIWFSVCLWQRDQEEVRRRFASITYSDPLYLKQPGPAGKKKRRSQKQTISALKQKCYLQVQSLESYFPDLSCRWRQCYNWKGQMNTCHSRCMLLSFCFSICLLLAPPIPLNISPFFCFLSLLLRIPVPCPQLQASLSSAN